MVGRTLFRDNMLSLYLDKKKSDCKGRINDLTEYSFSDKTFKSLSVNLYNEFSVKGLNVKFNEENVGVNPKKIIYMDPFESRQVLRDGVSFVITYPFDGDYRLFDCKPSTLSDYPKGRIEGQKLYFEIDLPLEEEERYKDILLRQKNLLEDCLSSQSLDISVYNDDIKNIINEYLKNKKDYFDKIGIIRNKYGN